MNDLAQVLAPASVLVEVDFCRGPSGAFLAIDHLVVAGDCTGGGRTIQSFAVDRAHFLRALTPMAARDMPCGPAPEPDMRCARCDVIYPAPAPGECDHCGGALA